MQPLYVTGFEGLEEKRKRREYDRVTELVKKSTTNQRLTKRNL